MVDGYSAADPLHADMTTSANTLARYHAVTATFGPACGAVSIRVAETP